jgi:hypothetical protein
MAGVLDDHPVAGGKPRVEHAFDAVERAAGHCQVGRVDPVRGQLPGGQPC